MQQEAVTVQFPVRESRREYPQKMSAKPVMSNLKRPGLLATVAQTLLTWISSSLQLYQPYETWAVS